MSAVALHKAATPSRNGLELSDDLTRAGWIKIGRQLGEIDRSVSWWIGDWLAHGERVYGETYASAMEATGLAEQTLMNCAWVSRQFEISRRREDLSFSHHAEVARLNPEDADRLLDHAAEQGLGRKQFRQAVARFRRQGRIEAGNARAAAGPLPNSRYRIIYADPPWEYEDQPINGERAIETHYDTMPLEDIVALPVNDIIADDAAIFLWATAPNALGAFEVMSAWGFTYKTQIVWRKDRIGNGYWARNQHELLLIGVRGDMPPPLEEDRYPSVIDAPRGEHSDKPDIFRQLIEQAFPDLSRVELFARVEEGVEAPAGWDIWGAESGRAA